MRLEDLVGLSLEALRAHRMRYGLSALAVAVGIAAVVLMSSIGEGTRLFVMRQLSSFGTSVVGVHPGKVSTGGIPGVGGTARKLTLDDGRALRRLPGAVAAVPVSFGTALVRHEGRGRRVFVYGATCDMPAAWSMGVAAGSFLPDIEWERTSPVVVLGPRLKRELFGDLNALGQMVRIGEERYRVIGLMEPKGQFLGLDLDDAGYVPVANALRMFNRSELAEVDLLAATPEESESLAVRARALMIERHRADDVTVVTQQDGVRIVGNIMNVVTGTVTAIAAISLLVGAIGILTILWIVVQERVQEIGLVIALGGTRRTILAWFLCEAAITSAAGGVAGLIAGIGGSALLSGVVPGLEAYTPPWIVAAALVVALTVGLAAGVAPALRAARMDPVEALRAE
ncbi:MAG: ABC transporter permease [Candidatus Eisenbacteria bacterium]|nr:ABC transporter permease [Candidatus Eisenbacteria bacterium]